MPGHRHRSLPYRPALDGVRALAVAAVVLYHVHAGWMRGGWFGVDLFFVLSGFLITSLLLFEHRRWGSIHLIGFWLARARRLLPGLIAMLCAVVVASFFWTVPARRQAVALDSLSSLFYIANWRMLLSDDQYFSTLAMPSPVRHTWSLAIEEQYYLLFPLLLIALLAATHRLGRRRRRYAVAAVLLVLAAVSVWRMASLYVPHADPSRVYYGTDTRAFELLIGAAAGALLSGRDFRRSVASVLDRVIGWAAVPALAVLVVACLRLDDTSPLPFRGGLAVLALLAVLPIAACASTTPSPVQRLLAWEPLRRLGLISYALYLWHWPVVVYLNADRVALPQVPLAALQIGVAVALATVTYRYVEQPIRRGGVAALIPRRPRASLLIARIAVPVLVAGTVLMPRSAVGAAAPDSGNDPNGIHYAAPDYHPLDTQHSVMLIGNSIPQSLAHNTATSKYPDWIPLSTTNDGCDPFAGVKLIAGKPQPPSAQCLRWHGTWVDPIRSAKPDVAVFFVPQSFVSDYRVDGKTVRFGTSDYASFLESSLDSVRRKALRAGAHHFAVMTLACHRMPFANSNTEMAHVNDDARVDRVNATVRRWAHRTHTPVLDQDRLLCDGGYHRTIDGTPLYQDGMHFTAQSGPIIWGWMAPQLQQIVERS